MVEDLLEKIVEEGLKLGAEFVEARYQDLYSTSVIVSNERIESIVVRKEEGIGVRVLANGAFAFFSSATLEWDKIKDILEESIRSAKVTGEYKKDKVELAEVESVKVEALKKPLKSPIDVELEYKRDLCMKICKRMRELDKRIVNATVALRDYLDYRITCTSDGFLVKTLIPRTVLSLSAVAFEAGKLGSYRRGEGASLGYEYIDKLDLEKFAKTVVEKAVTMLSAEPAPSGRFTVITDPDLTGVFIHEAFGHACEGDTVLAGGSILKDKLGEKIGSELVTVYDDPTLKDSWGYFEYDDEGVKAKKKILVDKGVLVSFITNREAAAKLNLEPNGGARAQDYMHPPIVRMSNTYIAPGDWSFEEMVSEVKYGVLLCGSRGGQVNTAKGTFQFNAQEAYLIEKGEITKPLRDVSLSGFTLEVLSKVDAVSKDFSIRPGTCGKGGQGVPAGTGGPYLRIHDIVVGGRKR